jgi:transcriptional regulator with XRE-family HTH domain
MFLVETSPVAASQGPFYRALGVNIAQARRKMRMTQAALAEKVGLSRTSITNIEKGRQPVQMHVMALVARALVKSFDELIPAVDEPSVPLPDARVLQELQPSQREWVAKLATPPRRRAHADAEDDSLRLRAKKSRGAARGRKGH